MSDPAEMLRYETSVQDSVLLRRNVLGVLLRITVPPELTPGVLRLVEQMRTRTVTDVPSSVRLLQEVVDCCLDGYERDLRQNMETAAKEQGVQFAVPEVLTRRERETLRSFVAWAVRRSASEHANGQRVLDLKAAADA